MDHSCLSRSFAFIVLLVTSLRISCRADTTSFNDNYHVTWGHDHALLLNQDREIQLTLDQKSGAGFESKMRYGSGLFHIRMKIPDKNSTGVLTSFYLASRSSHHDEIDLEFLGNNGPPYKLHTNLYINGQGGREQQILLWFDPTKDFHSYKILWNEHQIVFFVDNVPIRVYRNNIRKKVSFPSQPMHIFASIWHAEGWASDGRKTDWHQAPFHAHYQDFHVDGCVLQDHNIRECHSPKFWWNAEKYRKLNPDQEREYRNVRKKHLVYDYCSSKSSSHYSECHK
ncbi:hypothetical protein WN943_019308 [Citrus x changshan-huyou]